VPQLPQAWLSVAPGVQTPSPLHDDHPGHEQLVLQVRD
jgi:hypothetical protein